MNTFKEALDQGKIKEGDYFEVEYPDGMMALFRLFKTEKGYVMLGPPTTEKVLFRGKEGYDRLFTLADSQARKEYANDVFKDVFACSFPEREYEFKSYDAVLNAMAGFSKMYDFSDNSTLRYALASRCVYLDSDNVYFCLFRVYSGSVDAYDLYVSNTRVYGYSYAVRPEAIPKPTMKFLEEGCDGSKEKPWICLGSQDGEKTLRHSEEIVNIDKEHLVCLINEGHKLQERVSEWLAELEECAENLK